MAKKRTKKKTRAARKKRPRAWTKVTFDELERWRAARNIPKKKMAEMLGVTNSTYHNWARGIAIATPNTQERIRGILDSNGTSPAGQARSGSSAHAEVLAATGRIVESYLQAKPAGMTPERLIKLVRDVRRALES